MLDKMKETLQEFISNINSESLERTRKKMEEAIRKEAIDKAVKEYVEQFGYDRKQDGLAIDFAVGDFIAGAEFMYLWMIKEFVVIREADFQALLDHRIKDE